ncbi:MAG TPA: hypothetical protein DCL76_03730 [Chloroflexi bacterium]|nr:hypothetical protein [Chloroflexota bacterium]HCU98555.1 hypothetical protein [Chloroflexota bacterium]|tara:strand:+ start:6658 stop:7251 length:594 start_codon:yes stop_codon:yes gene_type:complete
MHNTSKLKLALYRHWNVLFIAVSGIYIWTAIIGPIIALYAFPSLAVNIYKAYSTLCHQIPSRSLHIHHGDIIINTNTLISIIQLGEYINLETATYQTALCIRCLSIYSAVFGTTLLFKICNNYYKKFLITLTTKNYIIFGIIPIALDYFLLSRIYPITAITVVTGLAFGFTTIWYSFVDISNRTTNFIKIYGANSTI